MDQAIIYPDYQPQRLLKETLLGAVKLVSFILSAGIAAYLIVNGLSQPININLPLNVLDKAENTIISIPLKYTSFPDVGRVATPHMDATIIGKSQNVPVTFLVDSGAKISALPLSYIDLVGLDRNTAKRIYLRSATNTTTYGYLDSIQIKLDQTTMTIPVAYAEIIEPLLGTHGFFDQYTVIFQDGKQLIIKSKG
jgi:hypothetical protein